MRELNFTEEELKKEKKGNYIASGSEASIYLHNTKNKSENTQEQIVIMAKDYTIKTQKTSTPQQETKLENQVKKDS